MDEPVTSLAAMAVDPRYCWRSHCSTPLARHAGLSKLIGAVSCVKHENHNPTGSFRVWGGIELMHRLYQKVTGGVITFSTGNHVLSVADALAYSKDGQVDQ